MSALFERLRRLFDEGHGFDLPHLRSDAPFAPPVVRPAAVLIAVTERDEPGVILTQRRDDLRAHPGQIAFPGGKLDPGEDAITAALREADEELAISPSDVRVIGPSDPFVTISGYDVTPVLGLVPANLPLVPNPAEVSSWFEVPLRHLLDPANHVHREMNFNGYLRPYIEIEWQERRVWGITAAIIANLSHRLAWRKLTDG